MATVTANGTGSGQRTCSPKYYADHPDAVACDQTTAKLRRPGEAVQTVVVNSYRLDGEDYVRIAGPLFKLPETAGAFKAVERRAVEVKGVNPKGLLPAPESLVHAHRCVGLTNLRSVGCFASSPALLNILDDVARIADRNEAARLRFARKAEPKSQATLFVPDPEPAPPPRPSDLKAAVAAKLAEQRRAADAATATADHLYAKLAATAEALQGLEQTVLEAFLLDTDAERLAALAVIAERLTN